MKIFILILVTLHFTLDALRDGFIYKYITAQYKKFGELYHSLGFINETIVVTGIVYIYWGLKGLYPAILFLVIKLVIFDTIYNLATGRPAFYVGQTALYDKIFTSICNMVKVDTEWAMAILKVIVTILTIIFILPHY